MVTTSSELGNSDAQYLDSGSSYHMTGHTEWLVDFDENKRRKVRLADNKTVPAEGTRNIVINTKEGKQAVITDLSLKKN